MIFRSLVHASVFTLAATLGCASAHAQAHFAERIADIKKDIAALPPDTTGTVVMLGDSITHGFFSKGYMPKTIHGLPVVNEGISGDQVDRPTSNTGVISRLDLVTQAKPAIIFVLIGINDMWGGKEAPQDTIKQYEDMVPKLKAAAPNAKIVLQSILPTSKKNAYLNPGVAIVNDRIEKLASENGLVYLDLHPIMEDNNGELKAEYTNDGIHLTKEAYTVWLAKINTIAADLLK